MSDRAFRIGPIRPPSEANSLLIQVTRGCTWNRCGFCNLYRDTSFKAYSADSIRQDIDRIAYWAEKVEGYRKPHGQWDLRGINEGLRSLGDEDDRQSFYTVANWMLSGGENVFLQDGNTTALSNGRLSDVLLYLRQVFPGIKRVTSYGRAENLAKHGEDYYRELKEAGLDRIHSGYESGSDKVLARINKGVTKAQEIQAGRAIKRGGIELSIYFMPGVGGKDLSVSNMEETADVINQVEPDYVRVRTAAVKQGTDLYRQWQNGDFELCSDDDKVKEIRGIVQEASSNISTRIVSDHMINLLQGVEGSMADENAGGSKKALLCHIDSYLEMDEIKRKTFQFLRRNMRAHEPADLLKIDPKELQSIEDYVKQFDHRLWDIKMNELICRYV